MCFQDSLLRAEAITSHRRARGPAGGAILNAVSFSLAPGDTIRLAGPSGSGKSTLLWTLARMLPIAGGRLFLEGRPAADWHAPAWRDRVALVLQKHSLMEGTVRHNLLLPWTLKIRRPANPAGQQNTASWRQKKPDDETMDRELATIGLGDISLDDESSRLSVGQSARLSLVRSLLTAPVCLLLDEPLAALDADSAALVLERLRSFTAQGGALLLASHDEVPGRERLVRLEGGALSESTP
jgi:putative ABC transport system ATP-binding protein